MARTRNAEKRVASSGKRNTYLSYLPKLPNPDPTLQKFAATRDGIGLYDRILQQFPFIGGYMSQWIDHVLVTDRAIKPAKSDDPELQKLADAAALRAQKAWAHVRNRVIVLQKLLSGRFYGFARAEKVARFDPVVKEWIDDLYDVPQKAWGFDDDGRDFLYTSTNYTGGEVPSEKFIHFQWGSADTKYGHGDLSLVYVALWKIQQIEEYGLQAVEDFSKLIAIAHIPRAFDKDDRADFLQGVKDQYRYYVTTPTDDSHASIEVPTMNVTANGTAGRQEYEVIRFYERWIQILLLGAPQTQDHSLGTGKVEGVRKEIWDDKTPLGSSALDQCLTEQWLDPYCDRNMPDLPMELRPRFESDTTEITAGLTGVQAQTATDIAIKLAAKQITAAFAEEMIAALGLPRARAKAIVDSILNERDSLNPVAPAPNPFQPANQPPANDNSTTTDTNAPPDPNQAAAKSEEIIAVAMDDGKTLHFQRNAMVLTDQGEIPAWMLKHAHGAGIVTFKSVPPAAEAA